MAELKIQMTLDLRPFSAGLTSALKMGQSFQEQFKKIGSGLQVNIDESAFKKEIANLDKIYAGFRQETQKESIKIQGDAKSAVTAATQAEKAIKKIPEKKETTFKAKVDEFLSPIRKVTDSIASIGIAFGAVLMTAKKIIAIGDDFVKAANKQEEADKKLIESLKNNNAYTQEYYQSLLKEASAIQQVTKSGDDQNEMLMALAINMGVSQDKIIEVTKGAIGLATQFAEAGLNQEMALKGIALAYEGNWMQLTRYIPELRNAKNETERMTILQKAMADGFKLATTAAETGEGINVRYANAIDDIKEKLGAFINSALIPLKRGLLEAITPAQQQIDQLDIQRQKAAELKSEFDDLTGTLIYLTEKGKLNDEEMKLKADAIAKLNEKFPNYFTNLEQAARNNDTLRDAIEGARQKLNDYTNQMIETAVVQKYSDQIVGLSAKIIENRTLIAELEIANAKLTNTITTDADAHRINANQIKQNNMIIEMAKIQNAQYAKELENVRKQLELAKNEALKYSAAVAPAPTTKLTKKTELSENEAKAQTEIELILARQAGITQEIAYWESQKAQITGTDYQSQLKRLQIDQQIAELQAKAASDRLAQYDAMQNANLSFYQQGLINEEQYQANKRVILQMAYEDAIKLYGADSEQAIAFRQKILDFDAAANQKMLDAKRQLIEQYKNAAVAAINIMQGFANIEAAQRQMLYNQNMEQLRQETERRKAYWDTELAAGRITQEQYEANIAARQAEEERLSNIYEKEAKKRSGIEKTTAIAQTTMATYEMATKAYKAMVGIPIVGPILAATAAAAAIQLGLRNLSVIKSTAAYATGGLVRGGQKIIQINEEGEEFVINARATRVLGADLLAKIMAFPGRAKAILESIAFPAISTPTPNFAFATGGSTTNVVNQTVINQERLNVDLENIKEGIISIKNAIENLRLNANIDSARLAFIVEKGNELLQKKGY